MRRSPSAPERATDKITDDVEERTPVSTERHLERCLPCLGTGRIQVVGRDARPRRCTWCRGHGFVKVRSPGRRRR